MPGSVFVVEWANGGGCLIEGSEFSVDSLFVHDGWAMLSSICNDFSMAGYKVTTCLDHRNPKAYGLSLSSSLQVQTIESSNQFWEFVDQTASEADYVLCIAPESKNCLHVFARRLNAWRSKCLFPAENFLNIASSKHATSQRLFDCGVQSLKGFLIFDSSSTHLPSVISLPALVKPDDGAGGERYICHEPGALPPQTRKGLWRIESFIEGDSVSLTALCGPFGNQLLEPMYQHFESDRMGRYVGGEYPLPEKLRERAVKLATSSLAALGPTVGFVGLDMVLSSVDESLDCTVDVNPRLTCSYVGLREIYSTNLADAMVQQTMGRPVALAFRRRQFRFRI